jgi:release factor glutamine methyltransferase
MQGQRLLRETAAALTAAGVVSAKAEAGWLLCHVYGLSPTQLRTATDLPDSRAAMLAGLIAQRGQGIPLQHLIGRAPFRHLELEVGPGVFIPRPETELIVELVNAELVGARLVVDLCSGSGAIALAVANEYPNARVIAVERSVPALAWLARNADARAGAGDRPVEVVKGDVGDPQLLVDVVGTVDVLLSNPPYVPERIRADLDREISHDPPEAVFAGADGLGVMPDLIDSAARLLRPGGHLVIEHDESQGESLPQLLGATGEWDAVADRADLAGRPRFVTAVRR